MLTIRLSRTGKRHKPQYRVVVQENFRDPWSPALEILGNYNPHTTPSTVTLKEDRVQYWISKGAQPSATMHNLLVDAGIIKAEKAGSVTISKKRRGKIDAKKAEVEAQKLAEEEAKKAEAEAKKAALEAEKAAAKAAAEAPAEAPTEAPAEEPAA